MVRKVNLLNKIDLKATITIKEIRVIKYITGTLKLGYPVSISSVF